MLFVSSILLTALAYYLKLSTDAFLSAVANNPAQPLPLLASILITYPIRIHFAWTTAATLVNWNLWLVSLNRPQVEVFAAIATIWIAAAIGTFRYRYYYLRIPLL
jgi:hypothetical protein